MNTSPSIHAHAILVDSHAHLDADAFDADRDAVLARSRAAGVAHIVVPATTAARWSTLRDVCASHRELHAAYGLHPVFLAEHREEDLQALPRWLDERDAVAVGECGLDYFIDAPQRERQRHFFVRQLQIARDCDLPAIIHARRAVEDVIHAIRKIKGLRGVVHSFAGSAEQARQLADIGFCIGIGGPVTYPQARRLRRTVAAVPIDTLLLETDSPDQPGTLHRGERNEPAWLRDVLRCVAELRDADEATIAAATTDNARRLFGLTPHSGES